MYHTLVVFLQVFLNLPFRLAMFTFTFKNYLKYAGFFNRKIFEKITKKKAMAITSIAVFYDIPEPNKFVNDISKILHRDGVWVLEQSYFPKLFFNISILCSCLSDSSLSFFICKK